MINDLLKKMSSDMNIHPYQHETDASFIYRLCYSALGQWCLSIAKNSTVGVVGTTKHNQTIVLNDLLLRFTKLFPHIGDRFYDINNKQTDFVVRIRKVYEETGYLLTDGDNRNRISNFGRSIRVGNQFIFFGLPNTPSKINGLGVYAAQTDYVISMRDFLIRDNLTSEEYFTARFDPIDFYERDIDISELEFFNPKLNANPSSSWMKKPETDCTVARKTKLGPFYRIMRINDEIMFADETIGQQDDSFTSYEYRRLYFALKSHYNNPLKVTVTKLDEQYSKIRVGGHLPNREYYLLLLISWPENNAFNKTNFIIQNDLLQGVLDVLTNIGIEIRER